MSVVAKKVLHALARNILTNLSQNPARPENPGPTSSFGSYFQLSTGGIHVNELVAQLRQLLLSDSVDESLQVRQLVCT